MKIKKSTFYIWVLLFLFVVALSNIKNNNPWIAVPVMVGIAVIITIWSVERYKDTHGK